MHTDSNPFSEREKDVIQLLLQGKGNKQIALELGIASRTVEFHLSNIYAKLKAVFPIGSSNLTSLTFTMPELENLMPYLQGNAYFQLPTLYPGLSEKQAFYKYLEENGYTYKGPWIFTVDLIQ